MASCVESTAVAAGEIHLSTVRRREIWMSPMNWVFVLIGVIGAAMLFLSCDALVGIGLEGLCGLAGVVSVVAFFGLMDGM